MARTKRIVLSWRIPKDPSGRYIWSESRRCGDSCMDSDAENLEQLEEFGDVLRAAMYVQHQKQQQQQQQQQQRPGVRWKLPIATVEEFIDEEAESTTREQTTVYWYCVPAVLVSYFVVFADKSDINGQNDLEESKFPTAAATEVSWEYNWKNIMWCLAVIVFLELLLLVVLLII